MIFFIPCLFVFFLLLEKKFPLRHETIKKSDRLKDNISLAVLDIPFTRFLAYPVVYKMASRSESIQYSLFRMIVIFLVMDYLLYWWHRLNHRLPFLWRFHQVHHADPDMDASTALRFHFGELLLSAAVRVILIFIFGISLPLLLAFDLTVTSVALFHHSNLKLNSKIENVLILFFVTPRFHQNHHSYFQKETDSNYSAIFSFWDRLHGSHTQELPAEVVTIGLPDIGKIRPGLKELIIMPAKKVSAWPSKFISRDLSR
jgi:sterol desaturase/sphingolipid hydroxylase (fatty acid hydroxylase superfamily)